VHPRGCTIGKIKEHLCSIYRVFLRDGLLELRLNGEVLAYEPPEFLHVPFHATPTAEPVTWHKEIDLDLGDGHRISGWAAILARASVTNAGFAIFRCRLIQGSHGEGDRPETIFGKPNKFVYQRLVGELEVEGFSVSHTKDGIQWEDWEEDILSWVKDSLDAEPLPLLDQAENYRACGSVNRDVVGEATWDTSQAIVQHLPPIIDEQINAEPDEEPLAPELDPTDTEACRILSHCILPNGTMPARTGLVCGYVQSGKTASMTAVSALAKDNGYRIIVLIAGGNHESRLAEPRPAGDAPTSRCPGVGMAHAHQPSAQGPASYRGACAGVAQ
jgi:hypothetical protein